MSPYLLNKVTRPHVDNHIFRVSKLARDVERRCQWDQRCLVCSVMETSLTGTAESQQTQSPFPSPSSCSYAPLFSGLTLATLSIQLLNLACAVFSCPNDDVRCWTSVSSCFLTSRSYDGTSNQCQCVLSLQSNRRERASVDSPAGRPRTSGPPVGLLNPS